MTNKELRSQDSIGKINNDITITIRNSEKLASLMKWKEQHLLQITKLCLNRLDKYDLFGYCMLGNNFPTLTDLKISNTNEVQLQSIFYGNLPNLIKFSIVNCSILICRNALNAVADIVFHVTNIKELSLENIDYILQSGESKVRPVQKASLADCTKLFLWMANVVLN